MAAGGETSPHYPAIVPIEAYGRGGFRFAGLSHRGSLLCLPDGIWAWPATVTTDITLDSLGALFDRASLIDTVIIGTGRTSWMMPVEQRSAFRDAKLIVETMQTGPAIRVFNVMVEEGRRVAAALLATP